MLYPTLTAAAVAEHFGMTGGEIARGVLRFAPTKMRMNILKRGDGITILNDAYHANPQSMRAAVEVLSKSGGDYKIAVLGDMFELGPFAPTLHAGVGAYLGKAGIDCLVAVGELARHIYDAAKDAMVPQVYWCETKEEANCPPHHDPMLAGDVRPAQQRIQPPDQLLVVHRLGHIIVHAGGKSLTLVLERLLGGEQEDRDLVPPLPQGLYQRIAVHSRHHHVSND
mgnify:CR=1 FL=1